MPKKCEYLCKWVEVKDCHLRDGKIFIYFFKVKIKLRYFLLYYVVTVLVRFILGWEYERSQTLGIQAGHMAQLICPVQTLSAVNAALVLYGGSSSINTTQFTLLIRKFPKNSAFERGKLSNSWMKGKSVTHQGVQTVWNVKQFLLLVWISFPSAGTCSNQLSTESLALRAGLHPYSAAEKQTAGCVPASQPQWGKNLFGQACVSCNLLGTPYSFRLFTNWSISSLNML